MDEKPTNDQSHESTRADASVGDIIRHVLPYLWPQDAAWVRYRVVGSLFLLLFAKLMALWAPLLYGRAVDSLSQTWASDLLLGAVGLTAAYGLAKVASSGFQQMRDAVFAPVAQRAFRALAGETFAHLHGLSLRYHISRKTGGLSRIIERGVKAVEFLLRFLLFSIFPLLLEILGIAIAFWTFDTWYVAILLTTMVVYVWFTFVVTEWRIKIRKEMNTQDTEANQRAIDSLLNFETVKYFSAEARELQRYDQSIARYGVSALKTAYSLALLNFGQSVVIWTGVISVMTLAALGVQAGKMSIGDFVLVNAYMIQVTLPLGFLGTVYREIRQALVDMGEMFALLAQQKDIVEKPDAAYLVAPRGQIVFRDVHFSYDRDRTILEGLNLKIEPGQTIGIVGPTGSGKSTICRLLFRFYDVTRGAIEIDGQNLCDVTVKSLHQAIGVVPQDIVLFNETIGYNIAYGKDNPSEADIFAAAKLASIHEFIVGLPDGYDTTVGERGLKLSGGERQRVGIARTLLKNPAILILDEATSALDTGTENTVQMALESGGSNRTVIVIAHRLSSIVNADQIIVLHAGKIVERGTYQDLVAKGGRFTRLWQSQRVDQAL
jgi:ATP-binding cassette, subfamily B, heavy metal transporter